MAAGVEVAQVNRLTHDQTRRIALKLEQALAIAMTDVVAEAQQDGIDPEQAHRVIVETAYRWGARGLAQARFQGDLRVRMDEDGNEPFSSSDPDENQLSCDRCGTRGLSTLIDDICFVCWREGL